VSIIVPRTSGEITARDPRPLYGVRTACAGSQLACAAKQKQRTAAKEKMSRPETFGVTAAERGVISVKTRGKSARYKAVELVLNQIKGALQRVSFAV